MGYRRNNEPARAWRHWRLKNQAALNKINLPEVIIKDEDHWLDFLEHGFLDHHNDPTHFILERLTEPQAQALFELLRTELSEEEKQSTQVWLKLKLKLRKETTKFTCPCCGYKTVDQEPPGTYDICPICYWEDDPVQFEDPDYEGGANGVSLRQAQSNFTEFGACEKSLLKCVRQPSEQDQKDPEWRSR